MMFFAATIAVLVSLGLALVRALLGPTLFDRVLAGNTIGTLAVLTLALIGFVTGRPEFLDIAILYTLLNLIGTSRSSRRRPRSRQWNRSSTS